MATCYYYVKDPIENFNLKVVVRESSRLVIREDSSNDVVFHEDVSISWQEKIDGPADIVRNFRKNDSSLSERVRSYSEMLLLHASYNAIQCFQKLVS
jgi:hypothetical protein